MPLVIIPEYVIDVRLGEAKICRRHDEPDIPRWTYIPADNWRQLEDEARAVVVAEHGLLISGIYRCPDELTAKGRWSGS